MAAAARRRHRLDPYHRDHGGITIIHTFMSNLGGPAVSGEPAIIDLPVRLGSDVNMTLEPPPNSSYEFFRGRTTLHFLTYKALRGRVLRRWPSKTHFKAIAEVLVRNGANPHVLTDQDYSPTMIAMRQYKAFCWWRESLVEAGFDLEDFVDKERKLLSKMVKQGWDKEALLSLFKQSFTRDTSLQKADFREQQAWWKL